MSKIIKEYWNFEQNDILKPYFLGQLVNLNQEINLRHNDNDFDNEYEYVGPEKHLLGLTIKDNIVMRIIYEANFVFPNSEFWNNDYYTISESLSKTNKLVDEKYSDNKMLIIFRDSFSRLIILQKGK